ncbi:MAG: acyl carrier protein [Planctomycetes bacterium]|nr:acyl carrier protein [Planctomycetota bacterium]
MGEASSVEDAIKQMIVERLFLKIEPGEISDEEPLMEKLGVDSVQLLEIAVGLEEVYGISFEDEEFDIEIFKTIKSIADFVREKTGLS